MFLFGLNDKKIDPSNDLASQKKEKLGHHLEFSFI